MESQARRQAPQLRFWPSDNFNSILSKRFNPLWAALAGIMSDVPNYTNIQPVIQITGVQL